VIPFDADVAQPFSYIVDVTSWSGVTGNVRLTLSFGCLASNSSTNTLAWPQNAALSTGSFALANSSYVAESALASGLDTTGCVAGSLATFVLTRDNTVAGNLADYIAVLDVRIRYTRKAI
jgi:hypothetical protein